MNVILLSHTGGSYLVSKNCHFVYLRLSKVYIFLNKKENNKDSKNGKKRLASIPIPVSKRDSANISSHQRGIRDFTV